MLDYTISTYEDQLDFAAGSGKPTRPSAETRTRNKEKSVNAITLSTSHPNKLKRKEKGIEKPKPVKSNTIKSVSFEDTKDSSGMTCFNCGKVGEKTGHDGCRNPTTPNEAGIKAKEAYRKKLNDKKMHKSPIMSSAESDSSESDSDSDAESDMCMITSWETDDGTNTDEEDEDSLPHLVPLTKILVPGNKKLTIFQDVLINSATATVMFYTGALGDGGNCITDSTAHRLGAFLEPKKNRGNLHNSRKQNLLQKRKRLYRSYSQVLVSKFNISNSE